MKTRLDKTYKKIPDLGFGKLLLAITQKTIMKKKSNLDLMILMTLCFKGPHPESENIHLKPCAEIAGNTKLCC